MALNTYTAAGTDVAIGTTLDIDLTLADSAIITAFAADTYTEVSLVEDVGEFGDEATAVTFTALKDGRVRKSKGSRDAGTVALVCARSPSDPGQDILRTAEKSPLDYNLRITLNDQLTEAGDPSVYYMRVKVMSQRTAVGSVDNVIRTTFNLGINSAIYEIEAD